jgi:hypothetical protein
MSNIQVGVVYQQIIADVVESSRVDFEEGGVDEQVLEELKLVWLRPFFSHASKTSSSHPSLHFTLMPCSSCKVLVSFPAIFRWKWSMLALTCGYLSFAAACAQALNFSRVGDPQYLALYPAFRL